MPNDSENQSTIPSVPSMSAPPGNMPPPELLTPSPVPAPVQSVETVPTTPPPPPPPGAAGTPVTPPSVQEPSMVTPPKKSNKIGIILLVILVIVVIGLAAFALLSRKSPNTNVTLTWWETWENDGVVKPLIEEYEAKNPGVTVNYVKQDKQDYRERLTNALAKGEGPDIFRFHNTWVPMFKTELDTVPTSVMSPAQFASTYFPVIQSDLTGDGGIKGIPLHFDTLALYINEDIFETYGKTAPTTWDELRATAKTLTIKDENGKIKQAGAALGVVDNIDHWQEILSLMMLQNGASVTNPTDKLAQVALQFYVQFASRDGVWDATLPPSTIAFANGKVAMYFGPSWRVFEIKEMNPNLRFKVYPVPQLPKENPEDPDITFASYWVEGVAKKSKVKDEAWKFMKFISSKESLQKLYTNESNQRLFGELYPRTDMAELLSTDPIASIFIRQAPSAHSSYLVSRTWDGPTGLNTKLSKYYEDGVRSAGSGANIQGVMDTIGQGTAQVLSEYGLPTQ